MLHRLREAAGSYENAYELSDAELRHLLDERKSYTIAMKRRENEPMQELESLYHRHIRLTGPGLADYPKKLEHIPDRPEILYYRGNLPDGDHPSVAIIGARRCSSYGGFVAQEFAGKLASQGVQIISGLAMGIDGVGQKAALRHGGRTFGVLGCGVDICYPKSNRMLYEEIGVSDGGLISEFPPGTQPLAKYFPQRNRIISGLADLILVVEARIKSGTMITVEMALEQGREVMAVPGRITDPLQSGCLHLIQQGAGMVLGPEDVTDALQLIGSGQMKQQHIELSGKSCQDTALRRHEELNAEERKLWEVLDFAPQSVDEIHAKLSAQSSNTWDLSTVMYHLILLCSRGYADQKGGHYFRVGR